MGARGRYRRWLTGDSSLDLEPGIAFQTLYEEPSQTPAFLGRISLNATELVGISAQVGVGPSRGIEYNDPLYPFGKPVESTSANLRLGIHFGSYPGAILPVAVVGLYAIGMSNYE